MINLRQFLVLFQMCSPLQTFEFLETESLTALTFSEGSHGRNFGRDTRSKTLR